MADFVPLSIPPGLVKTDTPAAWPGRWNDGNLVRWIENQMTPVPGWQKETYTGIAFDSPIRAMHTWFSTSGAQYTAVLCEENVYVIDGGESINITPTGGLVGPADSLLVGGYGGSEYGLYTYGDARPLVEDLKIIGPAWSLDNFGGTLLVMTSYDGRLLEWSPSDPPGTLLTAVSGAPTANRSFIVTPERHVMVFGYGGVDNKFGWCDQENLTNWTPSTTSLAGFYEVQPAAPIVAAILIKGGVLFFTTKGPNLARYIGLPFVYSSDPILHDSVPITSGALARAGNDAMWYGEDGFWRCDGVSVVPVPCDMLDHIRDNTSPVFSRFRIFATSLGVQPEIWWFFPSIEATENDYAVIYSFKDKWWSKAALSRTCGTSGSFTTYPLMADGDYVYQHENGFYYSGGTLPYAETTAINTKNGGQLSYVDQFVVDHGGAPEIVTYTISGRIARRNDTAPEVVIGPKFARADGYLDARLTARDVFLRIDTAAEGLEPWAFGQPLVNTAPRGKR